MKHGNPTSAPRGFTLVELVVAITVSAIVIGFIALFMTAPVDAYIDQSERAVMTDSAETISRTLAADLRSALPNSVRIGSAGTRSILEMILVESPGYFQTTSIAVPPLSQTDRELDFFVADTKFSVFGRFDPTFLGPGIYPIRNLIIGNRGTGSGDDAYLLTRVITPDTTGIQVDQNAALEESVTLTPGFRFLGLAPQRNRVFVFRRLVTYICNTAADTRTIRRYTDYPLSAAATIPTTEASAQLNGAGVTNTVLATNVASCRISCQGGVTTTDICNNTLVAEITVDRITTAGNDVLRLFEQYPLDNDP